MIRRHAARLAPPSQLLGAGSSALDPHTGGTHAGVSGSGHRGVATEGGACWAGGTVQRATLRAVLSSLHGLHSAEPCRQRSVYILGGRSVNALLPACAELAHYVLAPVRGIATIDRDCRRLAPPHGL